MFEEAPPLDLLRSIMVPESHPGLSRRFVRPGAAQPASLARDPVAVAPDRITGGPEPAQGSDRPPTVSGLPETTTCTNPPLPTAAAAPDAPARIGIHINFALDSDAVPPSAFPFLNRIGELMRDQPQLRLEVEGHTDWLCP
jgi:outer membrane protein OmpA-like peptidoglycan-associated protein